MPQSFAKLHIHLVFGTKRREPLIHNAIRDRLHRYMAGILLEQACPARLINSVEDHVHILFELSRTVTMADAAEKVKRSSSKWIKTQGIEFEHFRWQAGYGAFAVSAGDVEKVVEYIAIQREHHRNLSYSDEYRDLLERHGITYDERYLWD